MYTFKLYVVDVQKHQEDKHTDPVEVLSDLSKADKDPVDFL